MTRLHRRLGAATLALLLATPALAQESRPTPPPADLPLGLYARLETTAGEMVLRLEWRKVPITVANFVGLIEGSIPWTTPEGQPGSGPFYDGRIFHRVIDGFMIQGGCPLGTGTGDAGTRFRDEFPLDRSLRHDGVGVLSMANSDRGKQPWSATGRTNGSQFFITLGKTPHLDGLHSVFGRLVRGEDVLRAIGATPTGPQDRPKQEARIVKATVLRVGEAAERFDAPAVWARRDDVVIPDFVGDPDPARTPAADSPEQDSARVRLLCLQYAGCQRLKEGVTRSRDEALALAERLVPRLRAKGAVFEDAVHRWSDLAWRPFTLVKADNDEAFAPVYRLRPGQVSDAFATPYGVMIALGE